jgi:hypothetical protein
MRRHDRIVSLLAVTSGEERFGSARHRKTFVALGLLAGSLIITVGSAVLYRVDPSESDFYPPCPFHAVTGLYCPGCGTTRALHQLLHGHLGEAFGLNPLMILMLPYLGYSLLSYVMFSLRDRALPNLLTSPFWGWLAFWTILIYGVLRNIPYPPFSLLAP